MASQINKTVTTWFWTNKRPNSTYKTRLSDVRCLYNVAKQYKIIPAYRHPELSKTLNCRLLFTAQQKRQLLSHYTGPPNRKFFCKRTWQKRKAELERNRNKKGEEEEMASGAKTQQASLWFPQLPQTDLRVTHVGCGGRTISLRSSVLQQWAAGSWPGRKEKVCHYIVYNIVLYLFFWCFRMQLLSVNANDGLCAPAEHGWGVCPSLATQVHGKHAKRGSVSSNNSLICLHKTPNTGRDDTHLTSKCDFWVCGRHFERKQTIIYFGESLTSTLYQWARENPQANADIWKFYLPVMESPTSGRPAEGDTISEFTREEGSVDEIRCLTEVTCSWGVSELKDASGEWAGRCVQTQREIK